MALKMLLQNAVCRKSAGFTMIEVMVVVTILGLLLATGVVAFSNAQRNARDAKRRADVDAIAKAYEQYYALNANMYGSANCSNEVYWTNGFHNAIATAFPGQLLPLDPLNSITYRYCIHSLPSNFPGAVNPSARFCISARLERANGNCTGGTNRLDEPNAINCFFTTAGTGTHYCAPNRL